MNAPPPYPPVGYNPSAYPPGASAPPLPTSFSAYSNLPPPSYASSVWGEVKYILSNTDHLSLINILNFSKLLLLFVTTSLKTQEVIQNPEFIGII